jgi:hypothetical protein
MSAFSDVLNDKERKTLFRLGLVALLAAVSCAVLLVGQKKACLRAADNRERILQSYEKIDTARTEKEVEWQRWQEAAEDLADFRTEYLYNEEEGVNALRLDLEGIFRLAGMNVSDFSYSYSDLERGQMKKVAAAFSFSITYERLKRLLALIESFPKLLTVEKIDFADTGSGGGLLRIRMTMAGYYGL